MHAERVPKGALARELVKRDETSCVLQGSFAGVYLERCGGEVKNKLSLQRHANVSSGWHCGRGLGVEQRRRICEIVRYTR